MLWYNGDIKNPVSQAERLSVIPEGRKRDEESIFGCYCSDRGPCRRTYAQLQRLAGSKEAVETAEADVDTMLQRRADLIPNLVSTVKSYTKHETGVVDRVLEARDQLMNADTVEEKSEADQQMDSALSGLKVVVENYPELKSDTTYVGLMDELSGSENRISVARKDYNEAVKAYNTRLVKFPGNVFGSILGFEKASYFEADASAADTPDVGDMLAE